MFKFINKEEKYDLLFAKLLSIFFIENSLNLLLKQCFNNSFINNYLSLIFGLFFVLIFFITILEYIYVFKKTILVEIIFGVLIGYSIFINPDYSKDIFSRCLWVLVFCVPLGVMSYYVSNWECIISKVTRITLICFFIAFANAILYSGNGYNMALGYSLMPLVLFQIKIAQKKYFYWPIIIIEIIIILLFCSRGPLLPITLFFVYSLFLSKENKHRIFLKILVLFFIIAFAFSYQFLAEEIYDYFVSRGINSRTLKMLVSGNIEYSSGRDEVFEMLVPHLFDRPIFGLGLSGEKRFIVSSPHFLFLELLLHFGIGFGSIVILFVCLTILISLIKTRFKESIIVLLICCGFVHLMLSSTYLETPMFWMLISVCLRFINIKKRYKNGGKYGKRESAFIVS